MKRLWKGLIIICKSWWGIGKLKIWVRLKITWENLGPIIGAQLPIFLLATGNLSTLVYPGKCNSFRAQLSAGSYSLIRRYEGIKTQHGDAKMRHLFNSRPCSLWKYSAQTSPLPKLQPLTRWAWDGNSDHFRKKFLKSFFEGVHCQAIPISRKNTWLLKPGTTSSRSWGNSLYLAGWGTYVEVPQCLCRSTFSQELLVASPSDVKWQNSGGIFLPSGWEWQIHGFVSYISAQ